VTVRVAVVMAGTFTMTVAVGEGSPLVGVAVVIEVAEPEYVRVTVTVVVETIGTLTMTVAVGEGSLLAGRTVVVVAVVPLYV
jgi:hypothetical protein